MKTPLEKISLRISWSGLISCCFSEVGRLKTNKKSSFAEIDIYLDKHVLFDLNEDTKPKNTSQGG